MNYKFYTETIKIGKNEERIRTGEAALLFESESECKKAFLDKQGQNIGHRWVDLV